MESLYSAPTPSQNTGFAYLALSLFVAYLPLRAFYRYKIKDPKPLSLEEAKKAIDENNLFALFSLQLAKSTFSLFAQTGKPTSRELALALLESEDLLFVLVRLGIDKQRVRAAIEAYNQPIEAGSIIAAALDIAIAEGHEEIHSGDVFVALCQSDPLFQELISNLKLEIEDVVNVVYWQTNLTKKKNMEGKEFLDPNRFKFTGGIGRDWAFGYAPMITRFGHDFTDEIQRGGLGLEVIGRDREVKQIEEVLLRQNGGDVLLVGEAGIGKRTTVLGLAQKIAHGELDSRLAFKHLIEINIADLIAGGDPLNMINNLFIEVVNAGNVILYLENIQNLLSNNSAGSINAAELLRPFLNSREVHVVATCDATSFHQYIRPNPALAERFERILLEEPDVVSTIRILEEAVPMIESQTRSIISYEAIKAAVEAAGKYVTDVPNPEKSIDLLDGAAAHATGERGETIVLPKDINAYVSLRFNVPVGEASEDESDKLLKLEEIMHRSVVGQDEAVKAVANALRRSRAGVVDSKKPIGSFLFLGPTGVGKTETAKALALAYFGSEERMIRFDMSEYQNREDIYRFIGSNQGDDVPGALVTAVREHPFSLLLFDEIEKAHPDILDLFLQVLDEGHLSDGSGRKVSFTNTIIICTSNAGANLIRESIKGGVAYEKVRAILMEYLQKESVYKPEFLNRFTQIVAFSPLSQQEISRVAELLIKELQNTVGKNRGIEVKVSPEAAIELARQGFDPEMGARPMARVIQEKVENLLAEKILSGELKKGDSITIDQGMVV